MKQLRASRSRRGYAIIVVLSVIAMMAIYLASAHTSILTQASLSSEQLKRLGRIEAAGRALEAARVAPSGTLDLADAADKPLGKAQWRPLATQDPLWTSLPGITPRPGDCLLSIEWAKAEYGQEQYLFNPARGGAVRLAAVKP